MKDMQDVLDFYEEQMADYAQEMQVAEFAAKLREQRELEMKRWRQDYGRRRKGATLRRAIAFAFVGAVLINGVLYLVTR